MNDAMADRGEVGKAGLLFELVEHSPTACS